MILSPGLIFLKPSRNVIEAYADAGGVDKNLVGRAGFDGFGVAGNYRDIVLGGGRGDAVEDFIEYFECRPSSIIRARDMATGFAPLTARSFIVPHTASLPMSPPGKNNGFTT